MAHSFHRYRAVAAPVKVFVNYRLQTSPPAGDLLYLLAGKGVCVIVGIELSVESVEGKGKDVAKSAPGAWTTALPGVRRSAPKAPTASSRQMIDLLSGPL
ncbi:hypothetical protein D2E51_19685 [Mycobacteroides abscessus]|nr:hypothetical protein DDT53_22170 [Mycobacteroides abscessus]QCO24619.1 hypothetical protein CFE69_00540 [Mycobacteroides abscessus subsp. massiliense]AWG61446.1 hypothetical protein DDT47_22175 [Mycobacteroides abscessus]AWG67705.1 hypothetical protein DDT49_02345 [Mycobacteroides abscessus]NOS06656.1 hypothetical protein [Mycobacteroides abscessus]